MTIHERIRAVREAEAAGHLPTAADQDKDWTCPYGDFSTNDPEEALRHRTAHPWTPGNSAETNS